MEKTENKRKGRLKYVLMGIFFTAVFIYMVIFMSHFFWLSLPFMFTSWALAADYI
ncbi:MAG: hypothetical protein KA954_13115 [Chitinophagales bacterium]|nr:hypothetical protein [Bacteroidota bacterium]MBP7400524.1 hypothetical protein [Chitinophagales bacterium]MBK8488338.1 hypothetical protein [Bacteroidota bacterium]MBK8681897.1 hypothetical protein [Bacteroidota bacterium]MBP8755304.1 hypothetical protein [Chitinophagales bacterium]